MRTLWRIRPEETDLKDKSLEVVLPVAAELTSLESHMLGPGALPGLWLQDNSPTTVGHVQEFFDGKHVSKVPRTGYEESFPIPRAPAEIVDASIHEAVKTGKLWLTAGPASIFKEAVPLGLLMKEAVLNPPPADIPATALLPQNLPSAWAQGMTTAAGVSAALSAEQGKSLPWPIIASAIEAAIRSRLLEVANTGGPWPCEWAGAGNVQLRVPQGAPPPPPMPPPGRFVTEADLEIGEIQSLADHIGEIAKAGVGLDLKFRLRLEVGRVGIGLTDQQLSKVNEALAKASRKLRFGG